MLELFLPRCEYKHQEVIDSQRIDYGIEEIWNRIVIEHQLVLFSNTIRTLFNPFLVNY